MEQIKSFTMGAGPVEWARPSIDPNLCTGCGLCELACPEGILKLKDGSDFLGILLRSSNVDVFRDLSGKERTFQKSDVVQRTELKTSLMPPGLPGLLTDPGDVGLGNTDHPSYCDG